MTNLKHDTDKEETIPRLLSDVYEFMNTNLNYRSDNRKSQNNKSYLITKLISQDLISRSHWLVRQEEYFFTRNCY